MTSGNPGATGKPAIPDYELIRLIGRGSYGDVWLARGLTGVFRAIKIVWRDRFEDAEPFDREFEGLKRFTAISLAEPGQLALLHVGQSERDGYFYYVMELADDRDTGRKVIPEKYVPLTLRELRERRGRLGAAESIDIGVGIARALAGLHSRGLAHRDIKPSNVILVGGLPKLADIGMVTASAGARSQLGTDGFVPPEGTGKPAADVFAVGKLLYEMATGLDRHEFPRFPDDLREMPDRRVILELNEVVLRACDREESRRYLDAQRLLRDLLALQAGASLRLKRSRGRLRRLALALLAVALAAAGARFWPGLGAAGRAQAPDDMSVAVLPLTNLSGDPNQDYFSDGITEEIIGSLSREPGLRVPGRASCFAFKGRDVGVAEIARALNVKRLVEGSVQRAGAMVRVHAQLTRAADGLSEDLGTFTEEANNIFALEDEVARAVVQKVAHRPSVSPGTLLTKSPEAYDAYLLGRASQVRAAPNAPKAAKLYEQAVAIDPRFALAWARLAAARFRPYERGVDRGAGVVEGTRTAVERALALQPNLPEALIARADLVRMVDFDFAAGHRDLEHAQAVQTATADLRWAQYRLARDSGNWADADRFAKEAMSLDPQNGDSINSYAALRNVRGNFAAMDRLLAAAIAIQGPTIQHPFENWVENRLRWRGPEAALRLVERAPVGQAGRDGWHVKLLFILGRKAEARALLERIERERISRPDFTTNLFFSRWPVESWIMTALGLPDLAKRQASETLATMAAELKRGNRAPAVLEAFNSQEMVLGDRDVVRASLEQWRRESEKLPSAFRRMTDFNFRAYLTYGKLGDVDGALALIRDWEANGYGLGYELRSDCSDPSVKALGDDPRCQELMKKEEAWADAQPAVADL